MARAPRRTSSQSWQWPPSERRELVLARKLPAAVELLLTRLAEVGFDPSEHPAEWLEDFERDVGRIARDLWSDGARYEAELRTGRDGERAIRHRLESLLREHGIPVPTDPLPEPEG